MKTGGAVCPSLLSTMRGTAIAGAHSVYRRRVEQPPPRRTVRTVSVQKALRGSMAELAKEVRLAASYGELNGYCPDFCANSSRRLPAVGMITRPAA